MPVNMKSFCGCRGRFASRTCWSAALTFLLLLPSVFAQIELTYQLDEEVQSGTFVADIFRDAQLTSEYDELALSVITLRFLKDTSYNFTITNRTGIIRTQGRIDREAVCPNMLRCSIRLDVAIQPVRYLKIIKVTLEILDKNDNPPRFTLPVINLSMLESAVPGQGFVIPSPIDQDSPPYSISRYELQPRTGPFKLSITSKVDGSQEIQLVLNGTLDREQQHQFTFQLVAYDGGSPPNYGTVELQLDVVDANDNHPVFDRPSYDVSIPESVERHTTIVQVKASDPDVGSNGEIIYSLSDTTVTNYGHLFGIDNKTGDVFTLDSIDYETSPIYHLNIVARDRGPDSIPGDVTVVIQVTDINDHAPEITINTLSPTANGGAEVLEGSPINTFVAHITVLDKDSGSNAEFNCTLSDHHFRLQYLYDTEFQLVTSAFLNREDQESYSVTLTCIDHGAQPQVALKTIPIAIKDVNDHAPTFTQDTYMGEVIENNYRGAYVVRVNATDSDAGDNALVTYKLPPDMQAHFSIDPSSGVVRAQASMDREVLDQWRFYVTASDQGTPPLSSSALVIVDVQDVNDMAPGFHRNEYTFAVFENEPVGSEVGQVTAEDGDSSLYNIITYSFLPGHTTDSFKIDPSTGQIRTAEILDREAQPVYYLEVLARDKGSRPLSGSASVTIYINDRNDHAPTFDYPSDFNNTIYLSNQVPKGYVVTRVTAHDLDIGNNAKITYDIETGNEEEMFEMDHMHGTLIVNDGFKHINSKIFELSIVAKDDGEPQNMAYSHLNLVVNKSLPFPVGEAQHGPLIGQNFTIVISVACVSALVIVVLVIAIVCLKRQDVDRQARKYNCRMQALHMMSKDAEGQKGAPPGTLWMAENPHSKSNGNALSGDRPGHPESVHQDGNRFTPGTLGITEDTLKNSMIKNNTKEGQQKVWPSAPSPVKPQTFHPREHPRQQPHLPHPPQPPHPQHQQQHPQHQQQYLQCEIMAPSPCPSPLPMTTSCVSAFNPNPPVGIVAPSSAHPGGVHAPSTGVGVHSSYPGYVNGREVHPVSVERWRQGVNNRREMQVHQVLDLLKGNSNLQPHDTASVDSGQSSNTDSGCIPGEEGELNHRNSTHGNSTYGNNYICNNTGRNIHNYYKHRPHQPQSISEDHSDQWKGILT